MQFKNNSTYSNNIVTHYFSTSLEINLIVISLFLTLLLVQSQMLQHVILYNSYSEISALV
jgi:hypothetical protein